MKWRALARFVAPCCNRRHCGTHSTMPELRFWAGSNPTHSMSKIYDGKNYNDPD